MRKGAILKSSIELIYQIVENKKKPKVEIKNYFKSNRFVGAKDKRLIQEIVFKYLKNYFTLKKICKTNEKFQVEINGDFYDCSIIKQPLYDPKGIKMRS